MRAAIQTQHTHLTVDDFEDWQPPNDLKDRRWELIDGIPVCMAPISINHAAMQYEISRLIGNHLEAHRPSCRGFSAPGVRPRGSAKMTQLIPDLAISCSPVTDPRVLTELVVLIEILAPSNTSNTRNNAFAYMTIPSVLEIVLLSSTSMETEVIRREPDGNWSMESEMVLADGTLSLQSLGYQVPLRDFYRTTSNL